MNYILPLLLIAPFCGISQNGVGVGTTTPLSKLHLFANSSLSYPQLRLTESHSDYARLKMENSVHPSAYWDIAGKADTTGANARLNFYFANSSMAGDRMTITGVGNVGIGTTSPQAKVDIVGGDWNLDAGNPGDLKIGNTAYHLRIGVATSGSSAGTVRMYSQGGSLMLGTNNASHMMITPLGNVAIGTTSTIQNRVFIQGSTGSTLPVLNIASGYQGTSDVKAIQTNSTPATGYGIGGTFVGGYRGVEARGQGTTYNGQVIALDAFADGSTGTRIGVYARAIGGTTNWAGYFADGNVYVNNDLRVGSASLTGVSGYKLVVDGKVLAEELRIKLSQDWPDYVFADDYPLMPLSHLEQLIKRERHLPGIPSAHEVAANGIFVGEIQTLSIQKIEELTLYLIALNKQIKILQERIAILENQHQSKRQ
jgi:hypothetical protein